MKTCFLKICCYVALTLTACACGSDKDPDQLPVNDFVEKFTTGVRGRDQVVEVVLSDVVAPEFQTPEYLAKSFSISPRVEGKLSVNDDRILTFRPSSLLNPGTRYTVTWRIDRFFKTERQNRKFEFSFRTIAPDVSLKLTDFTVNSHTSSDTAYVWKGTVMLSDLADSAVVHRLLEFDKGVDVTWDKASLAKAYDISFTLKKAPEKRSKITVKSRSIEGYPRKTLASFDIPGKSDFDLYDILPGSEGRDYICLYFTRNLDPKQDVRGLVDVDPGQDATFSIEDNKIYIWLEEKGGKERTVRVGNGIKSLYGGRQLECDKSRPGHYRRKIAFDRNYPNLEFIGEGGIVPTSTDMLIPFTATCLRGVIVRVIRVYENNMGQFMQYNTLDGEIEMAAVGDLLCRKIIFLDDQGNYDLLGRNVFALNLNELIEPEPGALYRVILSYNYELSAYPMEGVVKKTKKQLYEENQQLEAQEIAAFGDGSRYYWFNDQPWDDYNWSERNNPASPAYYVNKQVAKNVLHSNLGIIAKRGDRGNMLVSVNDLTTGEPLGDVSVGVYTFQNQEIERKTTWDNGTVEFMPRANKEPFYIIARKDKERGYLRLAKADALSMSAFDTEGEQLQHGTKGFIYTDRGVHRPGDTIYVGFILNHLFNELPKQHPVTFELYNPSGQLTWTKTLATSDASFYVFRPVTAVDAPTGIWRGVVSVGGATFEKRLRIETVKPNRLGIDLTFAEKLLRRDKPADASLHAQWLTGATADDLKFDIYASFSSITTEFKGYEDYTFDDPNRTFSASDVLFMKGRLDAHGNAKIDTRLAIGAQAPGMLKAQFLTKVYEEGGQPSINATTIGYSPFTSYVGLKSPQKEGEPLLTGQNHRFDVATVTADGQPAPARKLKVQIYRVEWYWWWNADASAVANYLSSGHYAPVQEFELTTDAFGRNGFNIKMTNAEWGSYFVRIADEASGHVCGKLTYFDNADWYDRNPNVDNEATLLKMSVDKDIYAPGERVSVTFPSTAKSHALVTVEAGGGVLQHDEILCSDKQTTYSFDATPEMQPNVYVSVTLLNPYASTKSDLPIRLYGVVPVTVRAADSHLEPIISAPDEIRPLSRCNITVSEKNGHPMTFTLAVVDEGLLDLTNFKTPSPWDAFFAKEALGVRTWDLYKYVLGAYGGTIERIFSIGGDDVLVKGAKAVESRFKPVVRFIGPVTLPRGAKRTISFTMPEYVGKVRCMVVAANTYQYGSAQRSIVVSQPLMALGSMPPTLAVDDDLWLPVTLFAAKDGLAPVTVTLKADKHLAPLGPLTQTIDIPKKGNRIAWFHLKANRSVGTARVVAEAVSGGEKARWSGSVAVESPMKSIAKTDNQVLAPGKSIDMTLAPFGVAGSNRGFVKVSGVKLPNINNITNIMSLEPTDALGQVLAKAFALMIMPRVVEYKPEQLAAMDRQLNLINSRLQSYYVGGGGFSLWPGGTSVTAWNTTYAYLYLINAEKDGFFLPHELLRKTRMYAGRVAREWAPVMSSPRLQRDEINQAFRLFALAYDGFPERGAMNRLRQTKGLGAASLYFLASAYAFENQTIARQLIEAAGQVEPEPFFEPGFLDAVRLMTYELVGDHTQAYNIIGQMTADKWVAIRPNTFDAAFSLIGLVYYYRDYPPIKGVNFEISLDGKSRHIDVDKMSWIERVDTLARPVKVHITNRSAGTLYVETNALGIPTERTDCATANGYTMQATFTTLEGKPLDVKRIPQGTNFVYRLTVTNNTGIEMRDVIVEQPVAAGWDIINTRLFAGDARYPAGVDYQNIRDTQVMSFIPVMRPGQSITIPLTLTSAYAGTFYLPSASTYNIYTNTYSASTAGREVTVERD